MKRVICTSLAILVVAACGDADPVGTIDADDVDTVEPYDRPAYEGALQTGEAGQPTRITLASRWVYDQADQMAAYGPPDSEALVSLRCERTAMGNPQMVFDWNIDAKPDASETVTMEWGDARETFPIGAVERRLLPSGYGWSARFSPTGEAANFLLMATKPITFSFEEPSKPALKVPADDKLKKAIQDCI